MNMTLEATIAQELLDSENLQLTENLGLALRYYDADTGTVAEGMSSLVSPDVREAIESSVAEIMGAIASNSTLATFDPTSPEDVAQSKIETTLVHNTIFGQNRGTIIIESAIRDALLQRYAVIRVQGGKDRVEIESIAPENFVWSSDLTSPFISDARFVAERQFLTRAEMKHIGISAEDANNAPENPPSDQGFLARYEEWVMMQPAAREEDQTITVWYTYLRNNEKGGYDCHLYVETNLIIKSYWVPHLPFACGVATLRPHRFDGVSIFDKLQQVQSAKTGLLRQFELQTRLASQCRTAGRDKAVNPDDLTSDRLNVHVRTKNAPQEDIMVLPIQDVTSQILGALSYFDTVRREDGGASIDQTSPQMQIANVTAHAAERSFSVKELQTELMLTTLGETLIRSLYLLVHATLKAEVVGLMPVKVNNEYDFVAPDQFPDRINVTVDMGLTLGAKTRRMNAIMGVIANQQAVMQGGGAGILVTPQNLYAANMLFSELSGLANPESYWTNPDSPESQQAAQGMAMQAQQDKMMAMQIAQQEAQAAVQAEQVKATSQLELQHMKGIQKEDEDKARLEYDYFKALLEAQNDKGKLDVQEAQLILSAAQDAVETNREAATSAE